LVEKSAAVSVASMVDYWVVQRVDRLDQKKGTMLVGKKVELTAVM